MENGYKYSLIVTEKMQLLEFTFANPFSSFPRSSWKKLFISHQLAQLWVWDTVSAYTTWECGPFCAVCIQLWQKVTEDMSMLRVFLQIRGMCHIC